MSLLIAAAAIAYASHAADKPRPGDPPKVVSSNPKPGATIRPGPLLLSVTYDRPMRAGSASFAGDPALFPENCSKPEQSKDGRSYSMRCTVSPGRRYEVWFNRGQYMNFRSTEGISGEPCQLTFDVSR